MTEANDNHLLKLMFSPVLASMLVLSDDTSVKETVKMKAGYTLR